MVFDFDCSCCLRIFTGRSQNPAIELHSKCTKCGVWMCTMCEGIAWFMMAKCTHTHSFDNWLSEKWQSNTRERSHNSMSLPCLGQKQIVIEEILADIGSESVCVACYWPFADAEGWPSPTPTRINVYSNVRVSESSVGCTITSTLDKIINWLIAATFIALVFRLHNGKRPRRWKSIERRRRKNWFDWEGEVSV